MKFEVKVDRIEISDDWYSELRRLGDEPKAVSTATLTGNLVGTQGRVIIQVSVPYESDLGRQLLEAKRYSDPLEGSLNID